MKIQSRYALTFLGLLSCIVLIIKLGQLAGLGGRTYINGYRVQAEARLEARNNDKVLDTGQRRVRPWVILASTNSGFLDFTRNWLESLKRSGIRDHVTILAEDANTRDALNEMMDIKLDIKLTGDLPNKVLQFGSEDYLKLVNKRPRYILDYLKKGIDVLFSDVDTVWLQNPLPYLVGDFDIHFQNDRSSDMNQDVMCAGFAYYSATNATVKFITTWLDMIRREPNISDQNVLKNVWRRKDMKTVRINVLDQKLFPNGRNYFNGRWREKTGNVRPVVVHNNWIKEYDVKIQRFRNLGMWYLN